MTVGQEKVVAAVREVKPSTAAIAGGAAAVVGAVLLVRAAKRRAAEKRSSVKEAVIRAVRHAQDQHVVRLADVEWRGIRVRRVGFAVDGCALPHRVGAAAPHPRSCRRVMTI